MIVYLTHFRGHPFEKMNWNFEYIHILGLDLSFMYINITVTHSNLNINSYIGLLTTTLQEFCTPQKCWRWQTLLQEQ